MLRCCTSAKVAIAATNTAMPISIAHASGPAAPASDRAANNPTPVVTKTSWVAGPTVMSTAAAAMVVDITVGPGAGDVPAHTGDRQERIDGFADPTHPDDAEDAGRIRGR